MNLALKLYYIIILNVLFSNSVIAQNYYTLQKALQLAKANNPVLKTEYYNISIAQSDIITAGLRPNPILNNQTLQLLQTSQFSTTQNWYNVENRQVWWQLTKQFQIAGQRSNKIDFANKNASVLDKNYAEIERNLFADVAQKWLEVWTAKNQLNIIKIAQNNVDSLTIINQVRFKNQVITQTDLLRTELLAKQFALQFKTSNQEVINRQKELAFLLGSNDNVSIDVSDDFIYNIPNNLNELVKQSLQLRSDVVTATSLIAASNSNIKLQKSLAYPQPELGFIWNPQNTVPYFGIYANIDLPIFNRNQGEIKKSHLLKNQAEQQLFTIQNQLQTEISNAFASYQLHQQNLESFNTLLQQAQSILDNVKYAYINGGTTIIDFLEAQRSWLETQQQYYEIQQQYRLSYIQLLYTTGLINQLAQ